MTKPQPRESILKISPYIGGEARAPANVPHIARLASNENALGPSPKAMEAYKALATELHRYPDGQAQELRAALAAHENLPVEQIVCGAGSDELIVLLAMAYAGPGDEILYSRHGFLRYAMMGPITGATAVAADEVNLRACADSLLSKVNNGTKLLYLANPNNPTGSYLNREELAALHAKLPPHVLLVIDSAYAEYVLAEDYSTGAELVEKHDNVVMLRTFSKIYGLPGVRLGWGYFPPAVADALNRTRGPFNTSAAAQAAGIAALADKDYVFKSATHNNHWLAELSDRFSDIGLTPAPSVANFLLVNFDRPGIKDAAQEVEKARKFLKSQGVLVRQMGVYGLPGYLRMTVGTDADNEALTKAVQAYLKD